MSKMKRAALQSVESIAPAQSGCWAGETQLLIWLDLSMAHVCETDLAVFEERLLPGNMELAKTAEMGERRKGKKYLNMKYIFC